MIVEGQVHGGIAQGVGQALLEGAVYDKDGQLVTGSFMDYTMPRADNLPSFKVDTTDDQVPVESARHQGLRRGGRDRGAGRRHQRHHRCDRHRGHRHAGDAAGGVGGARRSINDSPQGGASRHGGIGEPMYDFTFHRPTGLRQAVNLLGKHEEAKLLAGGQTLMPAMKLRLAAPGNIIDLIASRGALPASS